MLARRLCQMRILIGALETEGNKFDAAHLDTAAWCRHWRLGHLLRRHGHLGEEGGIDKGGLYERTGTLTTRYILVANRVMLGRWLQLSTYVGVRLRIMEMPRQSTSV